MGAPPDALLSAAHSGDRTAPLRVLRAAATWAASAVADAAAHGDDADALAALVELDLALTELGRLAQIVPALVTASFPGGQVEEQIASRRAELREAGDAVNAQRTVLAELESAESALSQTVAAHQDLRERVAGLRRLERLAGALTELAAQQKVIDDRIAVLETTAGQPEQSLAAGCADLIRLTEQRLELLQPHTRDLTERAGAEQARLAALETETREQRAALAQAEERAAELRALRDSLAASLRVHAQADLEVVEALSATDRGSEPSETGETGAPGASGGSESGSADALMTARQRLAGIESELAAVDTKLARTIQARELLPVTGP